MSSLKSILIGLGILGIFSVTNANASFLIEPHLGYNVSGGVAAWNTVKYDYTSPQYGARLGVQFLGLMGGLDYTHSSFTLNATNVLLQKSSADYTQNELGLFVGYNAPILVRAWVGYYFSNKMTSVANTNNYYKGKTTELGVGFTPLPLISVNLMYRMLSFDTYHSAADSTLSPTYSPSEIVLGVSVPFNLL
jgi:hypothetical protein